jgi:hypothetical protein
LGMGSMNFIPWMISNCDSPDFGLLSARIAGRSHKHLA